MGGGGIEVREWAERTGDILVFRLPSERLVVGTQSKRYGPGGYFRNFWVGMCRWDPGTLNHPLLELTPQIPPILE